MAPPSLINSFSTLKSILKLSLLNLKFLGFNKYIAHRINEPTCPIIVAHAAPSIPKLNKKINIFAADSLKTLTIGENVTILELPQIPLYEEWQSGGYTTPLTKITCLATVPPTFSVDGNGDVRDPFIHKYVDSWAVDFIKAVVPLSVPQEAVEAYKNADVWKGFYTIQGEDFSGIDVEQVGMPNNACYDLMGRKITDTENLKGGIYIINGRKVMVK